MLPPPPLTGATDSDFPGKIPLFTKLSMRSISSADAAFATISRIAAFSSALNCVANDSSALFPSPGSKVFVPLSPLVIVAFDNAASSAEDEAAVAAAARASSLASASMAAPAAEVARREARSLSDCFTFWKSKTLSVGIL